jgi:hypothetical protein
MCWRLAVGTSASSLVSVLGKTVSKAASAFCLAPARESGALVASATRTRLLPTTKIST